ncbi:MAG: hypothetical protein RLZZ106_625 [Cyanobacteriota bacterium]|jgi:hypothetical protein
MLTPVVHIPLLGRFHHHAQQGLGAAGTHQHAAGSMHGLLGLRHRFAERSAALPAGAAPLVGHGHIHEPLGIGVEAAVHPIGQGTAPRLNQGGHLQSGEQAVAAHAMAGRENVT